MPSLAPLVPLFGDPRMDLPESKGKTLFLLMVFLESEYPFSAYDCVIVSATPNILIIYLSHVGMYKQHPTPGIEPCLYWVDTLYRYEMFRLSI